MRQQLDLPAPVPAHLQVRDRLYRALLEDLVARLQKAAPSERTHLAKQATALARLRLEDTLPAAQDAIGARSQPGSGFGAFLRALRLSRGLSQNDLARRADVDPAYISRIEKASSAKPIAPSRAVVLDLSGALQLGARDTDQLLVEAGYAPVALIEAGGWQLEFALLAEVLRNAAPPSLRAEIVQKLTYLLGRGRTAG